MNEATTRDLGWTPAGGDDPAGLQLARAVSGLTRARWRQLLVVHTMAGLSLALLCAVVSVLCIRLGYLPWTPLPTVSALIAAGVLGGVVTAWRRRPGDLDVAIAADIALNLKQRMSTAWEFARQGSDEVLSRRLAEQAVRARLPARSVSVFPLKLNALGLLAPVACIALVLVSIVDLTPVQRAQGGAIDESVVSEGVRLRGYARRMEARARRDALPRSTEKSRRMRQLGDRMGSGSLTRREALARLAQLDRELEREVRSALDAGEQTEVAPLDLQSLDGGGSAQTRGGAGSLLERLLDGSLDPADVGDLADETGALSRLGVSREELDGAMEQYRQGDRRKLRELLERMSRAEEAARDARELSSARRQVDRARQSLGDPDAGAQTPDRGRPGDVAEGKSTDTGPQGPAQDEAADEAGEGGSAPVPGSHPGARASRPSTTPDTTGTDGPVLQADATPGVQGRTFVSQGRALPRHAPLQPRGDVELAPRFRQQMEEVLANEQFAPHQREYIRRYFLRLSEGAGDEEPQR